MRDPVGEDARRAAEAHQRAMPLQRLLGNGMDYADAVALYQLVDEGALWWDAATSLAEVDLSRAEKALATGHRATAANWFFLAAACMRVGQSAFDPTDARRVALYRRMIATFGRAGELVDPPYEHVSMPFEGGAMYGWLMRPPVLPPAAVVIVLGGFDGWREEYHLGAQYLLDRGMAVLLVDGPGQGETRIRGEWYFEDDMVSPLRAVVDHVTARVDLPGRIGVWGNSMGGYLAAALAAADSRIAACCVNGGTDRPAEVLDRYPRFIAKVEALYGTDDAVEARERLERQRLGVDELQTLRCPLLVLHGEPDRVFLLESARRLFDSAGSTEKRLVVWPDGDHCIYNHSHEKHLMVGDWLSDQLSGGETRA